MRVTGTRDRWRTSSATESKCWSRPMPGYERAPGQDGTKVSISSCAGCSRARPDTSSTSTEKRPSSRCSRRTSSTVGSADSNDEADPRCARSGGSKQQPTTCSSSTATGSARRSPEGSGCVQSTIGFLLMSGRVRLVVHTLSDSHRQIRDPSLVAESARCGGLDATREMLGALVEQVSDDPRCFAVHRDYRTQLLHI